MVNPPDNAPNNSDGRPFSVGVALRESREKQGLSLVDVANRLKFAPRQIEALEQDNFARLPEIAFVRGFVRSYAKLLHLDPEPLLAALPSPHIPAEPLASSMEKEVRFPNQYARYKQNYIWLAAGLCVAIGLGLFIWLSDGTTQDAETGHQFPAATETLADEVTTPAFTTTDAPDQSTQTKAPLVGPPLPPAMKAAQLPIKVVQPAPDNAARTTAPIRMTFEHDSWVEVTDKNGVYLMAQLNPGGSERRVRGTPPFFLTIGNASGVRLYYLDKEVDLTPFNKAEVAHLTLE